MLHKVSTGSTAQVSLKTKFDNSINNHSIETCFRTYMSSYVIPVSDNRTTYFLKWIAVFIFFQRIEKSSLLLHNCQFKFIVMLKNETI